MTIGLLGKKLGMTQIYDENGTVIPVTVIQAGPCPILQKKVVDRDGYNALQVGFGERTAKNVTRPMKGHFQKAGVDPVRFIREFRTEETNGYEVGQALNVDMFEVGERVDVVGVSKGRGFAGTIKRFHTSRGPETHGSTYHRRPGSMSASADPSRVMKGKVGAGRHGGRRTTTQNLRIVDRDPEKNLLVVRGSVPGAMNGYLVICKSLKSSVR